MSQNGYPHYLRRKIIKCLENKKNAKNIVHLNKKKSLHFFCKIPYAGVQGEKLIKSLVRKLERHMDKPFKFRNTYRTKRLSYYCNTKDKVPEYRKSHMVYEFCWTARNSKYIGKTDRNFDTCVQEHSGSDKKSAVYNHLLEGEHFNYEVNLHSLPYSSNCRLP